MTAPTPVLDPSDRPDGPRRGDRRGGRHGTAVFISAVILLVVALGAAGAALVVRHDTSDLRAQAEPVREEVRNLAATEEDAVRRLGLLHERARATNEALAALFAAELAQVGASNHAVDVANQAVDRYNNAQTTGLVAAFQGAGDAALSDLEEKSAAVRGAAEAAQRAIASLQGAAGD
jgi:hypothetical protein